MTILSTDIQIIISILIYAVVWYFFIRTGRLHRSVTSNVIILIFSCLFVGYMLSNISFTDHWYDFLLAAILVSGIFNTGKRILRQQH